MFLVIDFVFCCSLCFLLLKFVFAEIEIGFAEFMGVYKAFYYSVPREMPISVNIAHFKLRAFTKRNQVFGIVLYLALYNLQISKAYGSIKTIFNPCFFA